MMDPAIVEEEYFRTRWVMVQVQVFHCGGWAAGVEQLCRNAARFAMKKRRFNVLNAAVGEALPGPEQD